MLSPTIKVSLNLSFPHGMRQKEWRYQIKALNSHSIVRGGEVRPIRKILFFLRFTQYNADAHNTHAYSPL
jgi:hypothetical protein